MPIRETPILPADWASDLPPGFITEEPNYIILNWSHATFNSSVGSSRATYAQRIASLVTWAEFHGWILQQGSTTFPTLEVEGRNLRPRVRVTNQWYVTPERVFGMRAFTLPPAFVCPECNEEHPGGTLVCPESDRLVGCVNCGVTPVKTYHDGVDSIAYAYNFWCESCGSRCAAEGCERFTPGQAGERGEYEREYCTEHGASSFCVLCDTYMEWRLGDPPYSPPNTEQQFVCGECAVHVCNNPECGQAMRSENNLSYSERFGALVCQRCIRSELVDVREVWDDDETELGEMPTIPGREQIRKVGIEIEGGHGSLSDRGQSLARAFYTNDLSMTDDVGGYHSGELGFAKIEHDSSCDWEAVIGPVNMADSEEVNSLNQVMELIREKIHDGSYKLDLRCGLHVHVGAEKVGIHQAYNLSHLFTYIEDPFCRIAAARWPMHRACQGNNGSRTVPKYNRKREFLQRRGGAGGGHEDHYYALSFANYFRAMLNGCQCGAVRDGLWDECECRMNKCTFEFRLFNTTANSRKLHAYLALSQALVAKAIDMPEIQKPDTVFPALPFNRRILKSMTDHDRDELTQAWVPRLRFMLWDLPLTDEERDSVTYCLRNSEIAVGLGADFDQLLVKEGTA